MARFKPSDFKNKSAQTAIRDSKTRVVVAGQIIDRETTPKLYVLKKAQENLQAKGLLQSSTTPSMSEQGCAEMIKKQQTQSIKSVSKPSTTAIVVSIVGSSMLSKSKKTIKYFKQ